MALSMFAFGPALSASEQAQPAPQTAQPTRPLNASAAPTTLKITPDEAVRMALENNLGVQADRLGPQIGTFGVAEARAAYAAQPDVDDDDQKCDCTADRLSRDWRREQRPVERQLQDRRGHRPVRAVGRRALHARPRCLAGDDEQSDQPVQPAARFEPCGDLHAAAASQLQDRCAAAEPAVRARRIRKSPTCSCGRA